MQDSESKKLKNEINPTLTSSSSSKYLMLFRDNATNNTEATT
jgi:hypothetical protein